MTSSCPGDNISQLLRSWDNNITDLVSGIPLKLLPIQEVNHKINLFDPKKCIHYHLLKCPEHFCEELSQKIERYTTAQWWIPAVTHQVVPMLCIAKKNSKLRTVFDLREQNDNMVKDMTHSLTRISFVMIWPGQHIAQSLICLKCTNKYASYQNMSIRWHLLQYLAHSEAK